MTVVVVRSPLRVSLFGGGTDYPDYFMTHPGAVIGFSIDKYIYTTALELGCFVDYRYRISYSRVETVDRPDDIQHPVVRALLSHYRYDQPTDFSIQADLPASAGLGSSSTFTVGLVTAISELQGIPRTRMELAREAIYVEQTLLAENVGVQDQLHTAFGGMNRFDFLARGFSVSPINMKGQELDVLSRSMLLVYTGVKRHASTVVSEQVSKTKARRLDSDLAQLMAIVEQAHVVLERQGEDMLAELAKLLNESWRVKRGLTSSVTSESIDELFQFCLASGALGGKLCGAGGGGFLLVLIPPVRRQEFLERVGRHRCIDFKIDMFGATVLHNGWRGRSIGNVVGLA